MPLVLGGSTVVTPSYSIDNSCRFNSASSSQLKRTAGTATDADKYTFSCWVKRGSFPATNMQLIACEPNASEREWLFFVDTTQELKYMAAVSPTASKNLITNQKCRDPASWYHVVLTYDSGQGVEANRTKLYLNGTQITSFSTEAYVIQDADSPLNTSGNAFCLGANWNYHSGGYAEGFYNGYMAEVFFCDGQALAPTAFGEFNSDSPTLWQPIDCSGDLTFGDNGFYLNFSDSADLGADSSGNSNDFTATNLGVFDQCVDSPTNNFNTLNALNYHAYVALSEGSTTSTGINAGDNGNTCSNLNPAAGKWYAEVKYATLVSGYPNTGVRQINNANFADIINGATGACGYNNYEVGFSQAGNLLVNNSNTIGWGSAVSAGQIVQYAVDCDNGAIYIGINNTWQDSGDPTSGASKTGAATAWTPGPTFQGISFGDGEYNGSISNWNFGNPAYTNSSDEADANGYGKFEYAPPTGYLALCTKNLGSDGG